MSRFCNLLTALAAAALLAVIGTGAVASDGSDATAISEPGLNASAAGQGMIASASALNPDQYGIADEHGSSLKHSLFPTLRIMKVRVQIPWDLMHRELDANGIPTDAKLNEEWVRVNEFLETATGKGLEIAVSLKRSPSPAYRDVLPTLDEYRQAVTQLREWLARAHYEVKYFLPWNEPNHPDAGPMKTHARRAGALYRVLADLCKQPPICTPVAGDFLDSTLKQSYLKRYKKGAKIAPAIWAIHPYSDGRRRSTKHLRMFLAKTLENSDVWFSEAGGVIRGNPTPSKRQFKQKRSKARRQLRYLLNTLVSFHLPSQRPRVTRFYVYQYAGERFPKWDSGLVGPNGKTRGMFCELRKVSNPGETSRCP
jgi:hypothetical protein